MELPHDHPPKEVPPLPWYYRVLFAINVAAPFLAPTQKTNLALLVSAILKKHHCASLNWPKPSPPLRSVASLPPSTTYFTASRGYDASSTTSGRCPRRAVGPSSRAYRCFSEIPSPVELGHRLDDVQHYGALGRADSLLGFEDRRPSLGPGAASLAVGLRPRQLAPEEPEPDRAGSSFVRG